MQEFTRRVVRPLVFSTLLSLNVLVGVTANALTVLSGSEDLLDGIAPANGGVTGLSLDRVLSDGFASLWGSPKAYPGTTQTLFMEAFDAYVISFAPNANQPVFYEIRWMNAGVQNPTSAAYLDAFSPTNVSTNYLGDIGSPVTGNNSYQVIVPAGHSLAVAFFDLGFSSVATYDFTINAFSDANRGENFAAVPLPAVGTGLPGLILGGGLLAWWRGKRKAKPLLRGIGCGPGCYQPPVSFRARLCRSQTLSLTARSCPACQARQTRPERRASPRRRRVEPVQIDGLSRPAILQHRPRPVGRY